MVELPEFIDPARRPDIFERLGPILRSLTPDLAMRDADAYLDWLADCPLAADGPVAVTGYCMGAGLALRTAGTYPERIAAAAGFHGANLATDSADSPHLLADRITAELYFGHADQDPSMPPSRSTASTRRSPHRACATTVRSTPGRTTVSPRRTPSGTTAQRTTATGRR